MMVTSIRRPARRNDPDEESTGFSAEMFDLLWGQERGFMPTAVDHAYEMIWRRLIAGEGKEGQRLSDVTLAAELGVSRTPVRQALYRLAQDGLVHADPRRGFWVRTFTAQDIREIYDLRADLEVLALRLALPHLVQDDLRDQLDRLYRVRACLDEQPRGLFLKCDLSLHNLFIHASGNSRLIRFLATLRTQHSLVQVRDTMFPRRMQIALDDHERILLALLDGDAGAAISALGDHIMHAKAGVLADLFGVREENDECRASHHYH